MIGEIDRIELNDDFELALAFINETNRSIFLTGKAGTGKTSLLKYLKKITLKKLVVVAPTGIAAITAGGVTIHSLFNLPIIPFLPTRSEIRNNLTAERKTLLRELKLLVIDEVSMLRADTLDAIDVVLRTVRKKSNLPFGGVQVLFIGDLYQLSPIALPEERDQLAAFYESLYFVSAKAFKEVHPIIINLRKIYRQSDNSLIEVLNAVREGRCNSEQVQLLNKYCQQGTQSRDGYVTLSTHNNSVDGINYKKLADLTGDIFRFSAEIKGEFEEASYPTDKTLLLKEGAQVMIIKNDSAEKKYFNGKIGIIRKIGQEKLFIEFAEGQPIELEREIWRNIKYEYDQQSDKVLQNEIGSFRQFPIRLAWAITIHKSQGLTFENVILDMKDVFAAGQAYVALSRVKSFEGLILSDFVTEELINSNANVQVSLIAPEANLLIDTLNAERKEYIKALASGKFDWSNLHLKVEENLGSLSGYEVIVQVREKVTLWSRITKRFEIEMDALFKSTQSDVIEKICERIRAACSYFIQEVNKLLDEVLDVEYKRTKNSINQRLVFRFIKGLIDLLKLKKIELESTIIVVEWLTESEAKRNRILVLPTIGKKTNTTNEQTTTNSSVTLSALQSAVLRHYRSGESIATIAQKIQLNIPTIENQLADLVALKQLDILEVVDEENLQKIISIMAADPSVSMLAIKQKIGVGVSFGQIKAVSNYQKLQKREAERI